MTEPQQPEPRIGETRAYWTHKVDSFPGPVAQFRMAQLIDLDDRLYETARVVYRFMLGWYHDGHGDALISQRHVAKVMKQRAPEGATVPSRNAVQRAILALMEAGWVVRSFQGRGRGRGASRYVPVANVLDLAAQGKFPELAHANGPVELARSIGPHVAHANGPVEAELAHANGPKTHIHDPRTDAGTCIVKPVSAATGDGAEGAAPGVGFDDAFLAYGNLGTYTTALAAWGEIDFGRHPVEHIIARAKSWKDSARQGAKRMPFEKWLRQKRYVEADRRTRPAPAPTEPPIPANDNHPAEEFALPPKPIVTHRGRIDSAEIINEERGSAIRMTIAGRAVEVHYEHADSEVQRKGQAELSTLSDIAGAQIERPEQLVGLSVRWEEMSNGTRRWAPGDSEMRTRA
ncbi:hypothetical protein [Pelagibacterium lacus]|uniref:Uncharacterized protein n=1 Tax=Pelagibacterium lacus TaxID=2282655 RepID=A0A369WAM0_9HYPH|nr:hypothetical protein [Pelagibacterium lacus]RDE10352.1 hypothetical protein DVH29_02905 [Pelagibacterium lacus]